MGRCRLLLLLSFLVCLPLGAAEKGEELRYTIFLGTLKPAGVVTYRVDPDGGGLLTLEVNDRGRGQKLTNDFKLDKAGIPVKLHLTGQDYWKAPVDEMFEITGGR